MSASTGGRLVLWNIDHTLVESGKVTREAYADAFETITGRPLVHVAPAAGRTDTEVIFETLALNDVELNEHYLPEFIEALESAVAARASQLAEEGQVLAGAERALVALDSSEGVVQSVLTGNVRPNALAKLSAFGLDRYIDVEIGGYGSENFPKGTLVQVARSRATEKYGGDFDESTTVLVADSVRDVNAAEIGGCPIIAVASGRSTEAELQAEGADVVLSDLDDTATVVESVRRLTTPSARRDIPEQHVEQQAE